MARVVMGSIGESPTVSPEPSRPATREPPRPVTRGPLSPASSRGMLSRRDDLRAKLAGEAAAGQLDAKRLRQRLGACHREEVDPVLLEFQAWLPKEKPGFGATASSVRTSASRQVPYSVLMANSLQRPASSPAVEQFHASLRKNPPLDLTFPAVEYDRPWSVEPTKTRSKQAKPTGLTEKEEIEAMRPEAQLRKQLELSEEYQKEQRDKFEEERAQLETRVKLLYMDPNVGLGQRPYIACWSSMEQLEHLRSHYNDSAWKLFLRTTPLPAHVRTAGGGLVKPGQNTRDLKTMEKRLIESGTRAVKEYKINHPPDVKESLGLKGGFIH